MSRPVELPANASLPQILDAVPPAQLRALQQAALRVRDYFVYKDLYSPYRYARKDLLDRGREGQDALLLFALALEARARQLHKMPPTSAETVARNRRLLGLGLAGLGLAAPSTAHGPIS